jgi:hypothetical protein
MDLDVFIAQHVKNSTQQQCFVHFPDRRNLASIGQHGLLSMKELRKRGIEIPAPGGNQLSMELDVACGMDAYVHLCFKTGHPMEKRARDEGTIQDLVHLHIRPDVIKIRGALITNDVANKSGITPGLAADMLDKIDLEVLYKWSNWKDNAILDRLKAAEKCELRIPEHVPLEYILNIQNG